ncbi:hypothetical protein PC116_g8166 [Phytophthora cactorum]|uniref:Uncharacterized protein n=3 Tax=Phytophthora cactorum TaxID=29920 RepID=A0A8T1CND4_9STRA|nr:hypothetical protein PC111_g13720 [Phytophthora cactorum]KAG2928029.1 hypothetical protein PC115_g7332 [Phytophthora cactorum]KAG2976732.1 hypothetical protein PC118_g13266 [Phytophthora cactorum]KAG3010534.1 hypothetical protein PC120_g15009 [Phytophthora cactorum]KAG3054918.1 hypothetical protein PC121_g16046 [Phytophthora cactorum]
MDQGPGSSHLDLKWVNRTVSHTCRTRKDIHVCPESYKVVLITCRFPPELSDRSISYKTSQVDMAETTTPNNSVEAAKALPDQTVDMMNADSAGIVDSKLGFGFLEGQVKQQLVKIRNCSSFFPFADADAHFKSVENTSTVKGSLHLKQIAQLPYAQGLTGFHGEQSRETQCVEGKTIVVFFFKRVIAKRSIPTPRFANLIPPRKGKHLENKEDKRWLVEILGNQLCTAEHYGGLAYISFTWSCQSTMSASKLISEIESAIAKSTANTGLMRTCELSQMTCRAKVKGFALPDTIGGNLTTVKGAMSLIGELNQLPIDCAVPVGIETIPIKTVRNFPFEISVETQIRDQKVLDKLTDVLLRLEKTGHRSTTIYQFVEYLMDKFEDASMSKRSLLPKLNNLVQDVARALAGHSKCVELYKRDDEYRLHTDNCDHNSVTASASEIMFFSTLGLASIPGRNYQWKLFNYAEPWSVPQHYKLRQFCNTHAIAGYYDRVKVELLFNDDAKVDEWRNKLHNLFARPVNQPFGWLFGARCS